MSLQPAADPVMGMSRFARWMNAPLIAHLAPKTVSGAVGLSIVLFWVVAAFGAPILSPFNPDASYAPLLHPLARIDGVGTFWLGTDQLGRDLLSRLLWGSRRILIFGPTAVAASYAFGILGGALAGYFGGWVDEALSRLGDLILSLPALPLFIVVVAEFGPSAVTILSCITVVNTPRVLRMVRGLVLEVRESGYVRAAQMRGENSLYIIFVEILPNIRGPLIVDACVRIGYVIIAIGSLGFLGLGLPPPAANWGTMIAEGREVILVAPHVVVIPCLTLLSFVVGCNLLADGLKQGEDGQ
jgi:peptide/nickel transport system permease protein